MISTLSVYRRNTERNDWEIVCWYAAGDQKITNGYYYTEEERQKYGDRKCAQLAVRLLIEAYRRTVKDEQVNIQVHGELFDLLT